MPSIAVTFEPPLLGFPSVALAFPLDRCLHLALPFSKRSHQRYHGAYTEHGGDAEAAGGADTEHGGEAEAAGGAAVGGANTEHGGKAEAAGSPARHACGDRRAHRRDVTAPDGRHPQLTSHVSSCFGTATMFTSLTR